MRRKCHKRNIKRIKPMVNLERLVTDNEDKRTPDLNSDNSNQVKTNDLVKDVAAYESSSDDEENALLNSSAKVPGNKKQKISRLDKQGASVSGVNVHRQLSLSPIDGSSMDDTDDSYEPSSPLSSGKKKKLTEKKLKRARVINARNKRKSLSGKQLSEYLKQVLADTPFNNYSIAEQYYMFKGLANMSDKDAEKRNLAKDKRLAENFYKVFPFTGDKKFDVTIDKLIEDGELETSNIKKKIDKSKKIADMIQLREDIKKITNMHKKKVKSDPNYKHKLLSLRGSNTIKKALSSEETSKFCLMGWCITPLYKISSHLRTVHGIPEEKIPLYKQGMAAVLLKRMEKNPESKINISKKVKLLTSPDSLAPAPSNPLASCLSSQGISTIEPARMKTPLPLKKCQFCDQMMKDHEPQHMTRKHGFIKNTPELTEAVAETRRRWRQDCDPEKEQRRMEAIECGQIPENLELNAERNRSLAKFLCYLKEHLGKNYQTQRKAEQKYEVLERIISRYFDASSYGKQTFLQMMRDLASDKKMEELSAFNFQQLKLNKRGINFEKKELSPTTIISAMPGLKHLSKVLFDLAGKGNEFVDAHYELRHITEFEMCIQEIQLYYESQRNEPVSKSSVNVQSTREGALILIHADRLISFNREKRILGYLKQVIDQNGPKIMELPVRELCFFRSILVTAMTILTFRRTKEAKSYLLEHFVDSLKGYYKTINTLIAEDGHNYTVEGMSFSSKFNDKFIVTNNLILDTCPGHHDPDFKNAQFIIPGKIAVAIEFYVNYIRPNFLVCKDPEELFISGTGRPMDLSLMGKSINDAMQYYLPGLKQKEIRVSSKLIKKSIVTQTYAINSVLAKDLANMMAHNASTAQRYYDLISSRVSNKGLRVKLNAYNEPFDALLIDIFKDVGVDPSVLEVLENKDKVIIIDIVPPKEPLGFVCLGSDDADDIMEEEERLL